MDRLALYYLVVLAAQVVPTVPQDLEDLMGHLDQLDQYRL